MAHLCRFAGKGALPKGFPIELRVGQSAVDPFRFHEGKSADRHGSAWNVEADFLRRNVGFDSAGDGDMRFKFFSIDLEAFRTEGFFDAAGQKV